MPGYLQQSNKLLKLLHHFSRLFHKIFFARFLEAYLSKILLVGAPINVKEFTASDSLLSLEA
jgi:hypothetical protein